MLGKMLDNVRKTSPLVHNITNYVTINDCANIVLACGASPIMANDEAEVEEITALCKGLNINIGTLNRQTIPAMLKAGKKANELNHPVVLDPVGVGASTLRKDTVNELINNIQFAAIRGNISEIRALALGCGSLRGVDADTSFDISDDTLASMIEFAKELAGKLNTIIAISGAIDIVTDHSTAYCIHNGHPMMRSVTGAGCMLSAMTAAYLAANPDSPLEATAAAVCTMGVCGEKAYSRLSTEAGNATYRGYIIDAVYRLTGSELNNSSRFKIL